MVYQKLGSSGLWGYSLDRAMFDGASWLRVIIIGISWCGTSWLCLQLHRCWRCCSGGGGDAVAVALTLRLHQRWRCCSGDVGVAGAVVLAVAVFILRRGRFWCW